MNETGRSRRCRRWPCSRTKRTTATHSCSLRSFPLPLLYAGFVKVEIEDEPGVWMRTFGCPGVQVARPCVSRRRARSQGTATFNLFANMLTYLREQGQTFQPGDTINVGEGMYLHIRERTEDEWFLKSEGPLLVLERIAEPGGET